MAPKSNPIIPKAAILNIEAQSLNNNGPPASILHVREKERVGRGGCWGGEGAHGTLEGELVCSKIILRPGEW